jgi:hypothetical protein
MLPRVEPLIGQAKPHAGDGPGPNVPMLQYIFQHPPVVKTLATVNVEIGPKIQKHRSGQTLREDIRELGGCRDMQDTDITNGNAFPNEVEVDLNMLHTLVLNGVGGELDGIDIVVVDEVAF